MEWQKLIESIATASPLAGVMGYAAKKLWDKVEEKDKVILQLNQKLEDQNQRHLQDLREIAKLDD